MGQLVMLRPDLNTAFKRSIRDAQGEITDTLVFAPQVPVELTDEQCKVVADDLGAALVLATSVKEGGRLINKPDWDLTNSTVQRIATEAAHMGKALRPHQRDALSEPVEPRPASPPPAAPPAAKQPQRASRKAKAEKPAAAKEPDEKSPSSDE